jgi:hypothetical protein
MTLTIASSVALIILQQYYNMIYDIYSQHFRRLLSSRFHVKKNNKNNEIEKQMLDRIQTKLQKPMGPSGSV